MTGEQSQGVSLSDCQSVLASIRPLELDRRIIIVAFGPHVPPPTQSNSPDLAILATSCWVGIRSIHRNLPDSISYEATFPHDAMMSCAPPSSRYSSGVVKHSRTLSGSILQRVRPVRLSNAAIQVGLLLKCSDSCTTIARSSVNKGEAAAPYRVFL